MSDLVAMTKAGELCVLTPLYAVLEVEGCKVGPHLVRIASIPDHPLAYILNAGEKVNRQLHKQGKNRCLLLNAIVVERNLELLGDL